MKFLPLLLVAFLAVLACKNAASTQTESTEQTSPLAQKKAEALKNLNGLQDAVDEKIAETQSLLAKANETEKAGLNAALEKYQKFSNDLKGAVDKVNASSEADWTQIEAAVEAVHYDVKSFLVGLRTEGADNQLNGGATK